MLRRSIVADRSFSSLMMRLLGPVPKETSSQIATQLPIVVFKAKNQHFFGAAVYCNTL